MLYCCIATTVVLYSNQQSEDLDLHIAIFVLLRNEKQSKFSKKFTSNEDPIWDPSTLVFPYSIMPSQVS